MFTNTTTRVLGLALSAMLTGAVAHAAEQEPVLDYGDFAGVPAASGAGYRVDPKVPVSGFFGQFTVNAGETAMKADGVEQLNLRVAEMPALTALQELSGKDVFVDAMSKSAKRTVTAVGRAVTNPGDTAKALPAGVGRFFKSAGATVKRTASGSSSGNSSEAAKDAVGINKAKREIAKRVGLDPYTSNPLAAARLDELANAAFAGGVSLDVVLAVGTGGLSTAISVTKTMSNLAWELPPADIRARNAQALGKLGVSSTAANALLDNARFTPTLALDFVDALGKLDAAKGRSEFVTLAASAATESEARFFISQLRMAHAYAGTGNALTAIETPGNIGQFRTAKGGVFVPAALDYVAWTADVERFASRKNAAKGKPVVWLTGKLSPAAKKGFAANGWEVREQAPRG